MSLALSRRGLFRALVPSRAGDPADHGPDARVARIGPDCVEPKGVSCRRCGEACEADAISFRPIGGARVAAVLDGARCTGCAECVPVCPVGAIALVTIEKAALIAALATGAAAP